MRARPLLVVVLVALGVFAPSGAAKDFGPGDLRVCNAVRCAPIVDPAALDALAGMYYSGPHPRSANRPSLGARTYELRFDNGYVTGIVATRRLDRFLSYGVHLGWFRRGAWYRIPEPAARELRRLGANLQPLRLSRAALARSR